MKRFGLMVLCGLFLLGIVGCGTIKGLGEDITTVGHWLTKGSDNTKNKTTVKPSPKK